MNYSARLSVLVILLLTFFKVHSQSYYQATVYFSSGATRNVTATDTSAAITSTNILNVLSAHGISASKVYPAFPEFKEADTLKVSESLDSISQMNKAKIFVITVVITHKKKCSKLTCRFEKMPFPDK
ncbi:MAG: hypothetical protein WDO19_03850 [Bacteroidota bacterium]